MLLGSIWESTTLLCMEYRLTDRIIFSVFINHKLDFNRAKSKLEMNVIPDLISY